MRPPLVAALLALVAALVAGCQSSSTNTTLAYYDPRPVTIVAPADPAPTPVVASATVPPRGQCGTAGRPRSLLAGRVLPISRVSDIDLEPGEVVLTFDDGPMPGKTKRILDALDAEGVKATFLMVGQMAAAYPDIAREVARRGHTIGSHTYDHANLAKLSGPAALAEIAAGERAVAKALAGSGHAMAPFFRFPYLADTANLRHTLAKRGTVVIDVDIDSKDYVRTPGDTVMRRTLARLKERGRGIILFHDIHARTASMLPGFLAALRRDGYRVVALVPAGSPACDVKAS